MRLESRIGRTPRCRSRCHGRNRERPPAFRAWSGNGGGVLISRRRRRRGGSLPVNSSLLEERRGAGFGAEGRRLGVRRGALREIDGEWFVVLPADSLSNPPWTVDGRPAVKLSRK